MPIDTRLSDLLARWHDARARGQPLTPEELCRDCPELLDEVRRELAAPPTLTHGAPPGDTRPSPQPDQPPDWLEPEAAPLAAGARLDKYEVRRKLGGGGMGDVYAAYDPDLQREVAIKVIRPEAGSNPRARAAFLREARAAAALHHDNVIPIHQVGEAGGIPFLVMPLLPGESLRDRLENGPMAPDEVVKLARETLAGLAAAHERGLMHRDIKPANLWLETIGDGWRVKVLDFGLARRVEPGEESLSQPGRVVGTPNYMSPEQAEGRPVDARTDLFSLGATLYEAATGVKAFKGVGTTAALLAVTRDQPPPADAINPQVPTALSEFIARLLAKDAAQRPASAAAALAELFRSGGVPPPRRRDAATTSEQRALDQNDRTKTYDSDARPQLPPRQRRWAVASVAVLLVCAAVIAVTMRGKPAATGGDGGMLPAVPIAYSGVVDMHIERADALGRPVLMEITKDARALPLRPGDRYRIEAEVTPAAYVYLFWIDAEGAASPVYPWLGWDKVRRLEDERPVSRVSLPAALDKGYKFEPSGGGLETVVMLARSKPLAPDRAALEALLANLPGGRAAAGKPPPAAEHRAWFDNFDPRRDDALRATPREEVDLDLPDRRLQAALRERLRGQADMVRSMSFATVNK